MKKEKQQEQFYKIIVNIDQLSNLVPLSGGEKNKLKEIIEKEPLKITQHYASLINWGDKNDPLLKIVMPSVEELIETGYVDTSGEYENTKINGLQHKYPQTALILATSNCASFCRFCFRKRLVGKISDEIACDYNEINKYIQDHKEINNVLLTGGDPMTLPTDNLLEIIGNLRKIEHIKSIRVGTRILAYLPQRIIEDKELLNGLAEYSTPEKRLYVISHFDHKKEISDLSIKAIDLLLKKGIILLNQSVLLKGVNDNPDSVTDLFNKLSDIGIRSYYLFQCRPVKNGKHFQVSLKNGYEIFEKAKLKMSGLAKTARYIMSHTSGKIEVIGVKEDKIYLKYHQAKDTKDIGKFFSLKLTDNSFWLDDLTEDRLS